MRTQPLLCMALLYVLDVFTASAQTLRPTQLDEETATLIGRGADELATPAQAKQWLVEVRLRPGITEKLWNYIWAVMDGKEDDEVEHLLLALAQRDDLSKQRETDLINRLEGYANNQLPKRGTRDFELALGLIFVLERGTDPRAEAIAIKLMNSANPDADFCIAGALRVMKKVGGPASLETISAYIKRKFKSPPEKVAGYKDYADAMEAIKERAASASVGANGASSPMPSTKQNTKTTALNNTGASPADSDESSMPWAIVVVMIAAAIGLLWLMLKGRAK